MKSFVEYANSFNVTEAIDGKVVSGLVTKLDAEVARFKTLHWNMTGEGFLRVHELFGVIYQTFIDYEDTLAEKARSLGELISISSKGDSSGNVEECVAEAIDALTALRSDLAAVKSGQDISIDNIIGELSSTIDSWIYKLTSGQTEK